MPCASVHEWPRTLWGYQRDWTWETRRWRASHSLIAASYPAGCADPDPDEPVIAGSHLASRILLNAS